MTTATITKLDNIEDLKGQDVFILFGKTRAGKSTFINDAYQKKVVESTGSMTSDTNAISYVTEPLSVDNRKFVLVDTIGLGGSDETHDRVSFAAEWVRIFSPGGDSKTGEGGTLDPTVKGFLYFIDITDGAALNEDNRRNLEVFEALIGPDVLESVIFVTTKWAKEDDDARDDQDERYEEWNEKIEIDFPGALTVRLDGETSRRSKKKLDAMSERKRKVEMAKYHENAMVVIRELVKRDAVKPPQLEKELNSADGPLTIGGTKLGQTLGAHIVQDANRASAAGMTKLVGEHKVAAATLAFTPITEAGNIKAARETAKELFGEHGEVLGEVWYDLGKFPIKFMKIFSTKKQRAALDSSYEKMADANIKSTRAFAALGEEFGGPIGKAIGGVFGAGASRAMNPILASLVWLKTLRP